MIAANVALGAHNQYPKGQPTSIPNHVKERIASNSREKNEGYWE
jgi:hypothetical protein